jgi:dCTP deaminase-like
MVVLFSRRFTSVHRTFLPKPANAYAWTRNSSSPRVLKAEACEVGGLLLHFAAPTIHAGFEGHITLEMVNFGPFHLRLVPGSTRICQLILERLESDPTGKITPGFRAKLRPSASTDRPIGIAAIGGAHHALL